MAGGGSVQAAVAAPPSARTTCHAESRAQRVGIGVLVADGEDPAAAPEARDHASGTARGHGRRGRPSSRPVADAASAGRPSRAGPGRARGTRSPAAAARRRRRAGAAAARRLGIGGVALVGHARPASAATRRRRRGLGVAAGLQLVEELQHARAALGDVVELDVQLRDALQAQRRPSSCRTNGMAWSSAAHGLASRSPAAR